MRKLLLLLFVVVAATLSNTQYARAITITHSVSQDTSGNSVTCNKNGVPDENSFYRSFDLPGFGIAGDFLVQSVDIGIGQVISEVAYPAELRLYTDADGGAPLLGDLTLLNSLEAPITSGDAFSILSFTTSTLVPAGATLVVEFFMPDAMDESADFYNAVVRPGTNTQGQTAPTYMRAPGCGYGEITDLADIGFPDTCLVMNVTGTVDAVPEPATILLLGIGCAGLMGVKAKKKRS